MTLRTRLARLEVQSAMLQDSRKLDDAELDAEIARLSAQLDITELTPSERDRFLDGTLTPTEARAEVARRRTGER